MPTETDAVRHKVTPFLKGNGCDIGCGMNKVLDTAIGIDLVEGADVISDCQHLPYKDNHFDYVYSSHLIEDFENTLAVLEEWFRVLRDGGVLALVVPDQARYEWHYNNEGLNPNHKHSGMGYWFIKYWVLRYCTITGYWVEEIFNYQPVGLDYNCVAVWRVFKGGVEKE